MSRPAGVLYIYGKEESQLHLPIQPLDMQVAGATAPNDQKCEELCLMCVPVAVETFACHLACMATGSS